MDGVLGLSGRLRVWDGAGDLVVDRRNMVVAAGIAAIVAKLIAAGNINAWKYVGFGTGATATDSGDEALGAEVSGGTYARLVGTQGEGATDQVYRVAGVWTNTSAGTQAISEYGLFSAASDGIMLCRVCTADPDGIALKTLAIGETLTVQWDLTLADA